MRFKKLKISVMIALVLFMIIITGIFSLSLLQNRILNDKSSSSQIGDMLVSPINKDEFSSIKQIVTDNSHNNSTNTVNSKITSTPRQPLHKVVTTRAS